MVSPVPTRSRSHTTAPRPRSSYMLLSNLDRRTSLCAEDMGRVLAWPDTGGNSGRAPPPHSQDTQVRMDTRRRVALELYESEKTYVQGLATIDRLYYAPLYDGMGRDDAIVSRSTLNRIFSNFVDILQLSRELLFRLEERLGDPLAAMGTSAPQVAVAEWDPWSDVLGDLLVPIAPFFKMYTLFMKNFASAMQALDEERRSNDVFDAFLKRAEAAARRAGGGAELGLQAQMLTLVQRVPRYRLLLQELLRNTPPWHPDHEPLRETFRVVDHTALFINEHVRQQELALIALALQRMLVGLDEPLVVPGRRLLRHGTLLKTRRKNIQPRQVYLFSDCILLASASVLGDAPPAPWDDAPREEMDWTTAPLSLLGGPSLYLTHKLPLADCTVIGYDEAAAPPTGLPTSTSMPDLSASVGRAPLPLRHRFDVHSPQCSFSLYAATSSAKSMWIAAIREAQEEHIAAMRSLKKTESPPVNRHSSCSSGSSAASSEPALSVSGSPPRSPVPRAAHGVAALLSPRRERALPALEHYHAPVWVPDSFSVRCARCVEPFTLWRRKHHCRLCGQVFCAACSSCYVLLPPAVSGAPNTKARACMACYASTFRAQRAPATPQTPKLECSPALPTTPTARRPSSHALRPVLHALTPSMPPPALPAPRTEPKTPKARPKHARRWSIVSVPLADQTEHTPPLHVHASTSGTLTLELQEQPPTTPTPRSAPIMPSPVALGAPLLPCTTHQHSPVSSSHAAQWLQSMLSPPTPLRAP